MAFKQAKRNLKDLLVKIAGEDKRDFIGICLAWKQIVGRIIAEKSFVWSLKEDVLYIGVVNSVWMQELILQKDFLLRELNKITDHTNIKQIIFILKSRKLKWNLK